MTITEEYQKIKQNGKKLDMSRGKPSSEQFDKMEKLLSQININKDCYSENGTDCRNYGGLDGIPEAKRVFSSMLEIPEENIAVGGNSSLNLMYDLIAQAFVFGIRGQKPWSAQKTKFLCPVPGYDRHFAITEHFGIEMISVPMLPTGPDMDIVEKLVSTDSSIKGIWNVPKYSNPTGVTYSDDTVLHFASLKPAAKDFCIIWDDAYCVHDLNDTPDNLLNLFAQAQKFKNENNVYIFASTSKITYSGAGISCIASSKDNIKEYLNELSIHTICNDKLNMLRHAKLLQSKENVLQIMDMHKSVISKKFDLCIEYFKNELSDINGVSWSKPNGGYFITLYVPFGKAKKIVSLSKDAGLILTSAGAGFPYNIDPDDSVIRIAPTYPTLIELENALKLLCICVKLGCQ